MWHVGDGRWREVAGMTRGYMYCKMLFPVEWADISEDKQCNYSEHDINIKSLRNHIWNYWTISHHISSVRKKSHFYWVRKEIRNQTMNTASWTDLLPRPSVFTPPSSTVFSYAALWKSCTFYQMSGDIASVSQLFLSLGVVGWSPNPVTVACL